MRAMIGRGANVNQVLIVQGALQPNRFKMVLVKESLGF